MCMLVSVVTVCFNAEQDIGKTMASVLQQGADLYEYLVIDGASTDRTMEIVDSFRPAFEKKGVRFVSVSEKDAGIYSAMNKGARLASGEWINYMNAGDRFISPGTLKKFQKPLSESDAQVVYGSTVLLRDDEMRDYPPYPLEKMPKRQTLCHQSTFIRSSLLRQRPYDERYRGAGDYDFFLWAYTQGVKFQRVDEYVALFQKGGYSSTHTHIMEYEILKVRFTHGVIRRRHFYKRMVLLALGQIGYAFSTKAEKQRQEDKRAAKDTGWVKSKYGEI